MSDEITEIKFLFPPNLQKWWIISAAVFFFFGAVTLLFSLYGDFDSDQRLILMVIGLVLLGISLYGHFTKNKFNYDILLTKETITKNYLDGPTQSIKWDDIFKIVVKNIGGLIILKYNRNVDDLKIDIQISEALILLNILTDVHSGVVTMDEVLKEYSAP